MDNQPKLPRTSSKNITPNNDDIEGTAAKKAAVAEGPIFFAALAISSKPITFGTTPW